MTTITATRAIDVRRILRRLRRPPPAQTLNSLDAYARWASHYPPQAHNALMQCEESLMLRLMPDPAGCVVLDLACGTGRYGLIMREKAAARVIGCDNSPAMLAANPMSALALAHSESIPLPSAVVDLVLCGLALGHVPDLRPSMQEISRVLKPDGIALVSDFHPAMFLDGGRRSFTDADGTTYAVEHYVHQSETYRQAAHDAGLVVAAVKESSVPGAPSSAPAVIAYLLRKNT